MARNKTEKQQEAVLCRQHCEKHSPTAVLFVHGIRSTPEAWKPMLANLAKLENSWFVEQNACLLTFKYDSPTFRLNPLRRIPDLGTIAAQLRTQLKSHECLRHARKLVLVGHSQGGLVIQHCLVETLGDANGGGRELERIRKVVLFATPNLGSELLLSVRRGLGRLLGRVLTPQEATLRPFDEEVHRASRLIQSNVVYAQRVTASTCPIEFDVYAGTTDNVVPRSSARALFPNAQTCTGDHSTVIQTEEAAEHVLTAIQKAHYASPADRVEVSVETIDVSDPQQVNAVVEMVGASFEAFAAGGTRTLRHWLTDHRYEKEWRNQLIMAAVRVEGVIRGCLEYQVYDDVLVIDWVALSPGLYRGRDLAWRLLLEYLGREIESWDITHIVFEVQDPKRAHDKQKTRAEARVRYFERAGARIIGGIHYKSVDLIDPRKSREAPYFLMYFARGKMPPSLSGFLVKQWVRLLYTRWYGNWFQRDYGDAVQSYLEKAADRVCGRVPQDCDLLTLREVKQLRKTARKKRGARSG